MKHTIKQAKQMLGIMDTVITHVVEKTDADIKWTGPKINREQWEEMLAFFKWTYDLNKSESQVRLFVNQDKWAIWAFPQKANTGMTAIELETEESVKQRDMFREPDGWHYFGTVHSHCSASAFQSGTDAANEIKVDGLHITIGKIDDPKQYDLHARLMIGGLTFAPNLSWFWDVGEIGEQLPADMHHPIARFQMTKAIKEDAKFPQQWKDNYIEVKPAIVHMSNSHWTGHDYERNKEYDKCKLASWKINKVQKAMADFEIDLFQKGHDMEKKDWFDVVLDLAEMDHEFLDMIRAMGKEDVVWEDVLTLAHFLNEKREEKLLEKELEKELEEEEADRKAAMGESPEEVDEAVDSIRKLQMEMAAEGGKTGPDEEDATKSYELEAERRRKEQLEIQEELVRRAYGFD